MNMAESCSDDEFAILQFGSNEELQQSINENKAKNTCNYQEQQKVSKN